MVAENAAIRILGRPMPEAAETLSTEMPEQPAGSSPKSPPAVSAWERFCFSVMRRLVRAHTHFWGIHGLYLSARAFGTLEYLVNFKRRRRVRRMIETVLQRRLHGPDRRRLVRAHFMRERCDKVFYLIFDYFPTEEARTRFSIANRHLLDEGLAREKGVYVMLCHHGAHHVVGMLMSLSGYRVAGVRDPNEGAVRRYVQELWERRHPDVPRAKVLYSGDFTRPIYRLLKENYALGSALDVSRVRDPRLRTAPVQIFGETRNFLTGTLQIAIRSQSTVVQGVIVAEEDFRYRLELIGPMTDPETCQDTPEVLQQVLQRYADNIAEYARQYPDHVTRV